MSHLLVRAALLHRADVARLVLGGAAGRVAAAVRGGRIFRQAGRAVRGGLLGGCSGAVQKTYRRTTICPPRWLSIGWRATIC